MTTLPNFDELNNIRTTLTEMLAVDTSDTTNEPRGHVDRKRLEDTIFELITMGYVYGIEVAGLDLEADLPVSSERMVSVAMMPTKGETFTDRVRTHIDAYERGETDAERLAEQLAVVAETETHRAINTGGQDGAEDYARTNRDTTVFKEWRTMMDDRVREQHEWLEGAKVPLDARFYTPDGDSALYPGDFMYPENNVNCRCICRYTKA